MIVRKRKKLWLEATTLSVEAETTSSSITSTKLLLQSSPKQHPQFQSFEKDNFLPQLNSVRFASNNFYRSPNHEQSSTASVFVLFSSAISSTCDPSVCSLSSQGIVSPLSSTFSQACVTAQDEQPNNKRANYYFFRSSTNTSTNTSNNLNRKIVIPNIRSYIFQILLCFLSYFVVLTSSANFYELVYYAGGGTSTADSIPATSANLSTPTAVFADTLGGLYVTESIRQRVRYIDSSGTIKTIAGGTISSTTSTTAIGDGGQATSAILITPNGVCGTTTGLLYIVETSRNRIRRLNVNTGIISTFVSATTVSSATGLNSPTICRVDGTMLYVVDRDNCLIRSVDITSSLTSSSATGTLVTFAGSNCGGNYGGDGSIATSANVKLGVMYGLAKDSTALYVAAGAGVRKIDATSKVINKYAGVPTTPGYIDDIITTSARFYTVFGSYLDTSASEYFLCDYDSTYTYLTSGLGRVRKISSTGIVSTIAGTTTASSGSSSSGIYGTAALLYAPSDITGDSSGNLYVLESGTGMIKRLKPVVPSPAPSSPPTIRPSTVPTAAPTFVPTVRPSVVPSVLPTMVPSLVPTAAPSVAPSTSPTQLPTAFPTLQPTTMRPSFGPTMFPTVLPTPIPSTRPSEAPTVPPSTSPTISPSAGPTEKPTTAPTVWPTTAPTSLPTVMPTTTPSFCPSMIPTVAPSNEPTQGPTVPPSNEPTQGPTAAPSNEPTQGPTVVPSNDPTQSPSLNPTVAPSTAPTNSPSFSPTDIPTVSPTGSPTVIPTTDPSEAPTAIPSESPSAEPTAAPSLAPSSAPSIDPTAVPSSCPTLVPTSIPSIEPTLAPTVDPTNEPTWRTSPRPTALPTVVPTLAPTTATPSSSPTISPSEVPSLVPSIDPSVQPTSAPSDAPTFNPSSLPTEIPTLFPTELPTAKPTLIPTTLPSLSPSSEPSESPSAKPSSVPTVFPSSHPTMAPSTLAPTFSPTDSPSCAPTMIPTKTLLPTVEPTLLPSVAPTASLTEAPSVLPTVIPTVAPTKKYQKFPTQPPTEVPSNVPTPTTAPSISPSLYPTPFPTLLPSVLPTTEPTLVPTVVPSSLPSQYPTVEPTLSPTVVPSISPSTMLPTIEKTWTPSVTPTSSPTGGPTLSPTAAPTLRTTLAPSEPPSAEPTVMSTLLPTKVPSVVPSQGPSVQPSLYPTQTPSYDPTTVPTLSPSCMPTTISPSVEPSTTPSSCPTLEPTRNPTVFPSVVPTIEPSTSPSASPSVIPSVKPSVLPSRLPSAAPSSSPTVTPTKEPSLEPTDRPTVEPSPSPTQSPTAMPSVVPSGFPTVAPTATPTVLPTAFPSAEPTVFPTAVPSILPTVEPSSPPSTLPTIAPTVTPTIAPTVLPSIAPSIAPTSQPNQVIPLITKAQLSDDGSFVLLTFNVDTNRGEVTTNPFACASKFDFSGVQFARCLWQDSRQLQIFPSFQEGDLAVALNTGYSVHMLAGNSIKRSCLTTVSANNSCNSVLEAKEQIILIESPSSPLKVKAVLHLPSIISSCDNLKVDLTASTGDGSRGFRSVEFQVTSTETTSALQIAQYLEENYSFYIPFEVPSSLLLSSTNYVVTLHVCNFLSQCDSITTSVAVSGTEATAPPAVVIAGSSSRTMYRSSALSLSSTASVYRCGMLLIPQPSMSYTWTVSAIVENGTVSSLPSIMSITRDRTRFLTASNTFEAGVMYSISVRVTDVSTKLSSSATVLVTVLSSDVIAKLEPSTSQILRVRDNLLLSASGSYDPDYLDSSLRFTWSCAGCPLQFLPTLPASNNSSMIVVASDDRLAGQVYRVWVQVSNVLSVSTVRTASQYLDIEVVERSKPSVKILTSTSDVNNINIDRRLVLSGSAQSEVDACQASWSVIDANIDLSSVALTSSTATVPNSNTLVSWNFVIAANSLVAGSSYTFALTCGASSTSIVVKTNSAPSGGSFLLTPSRGIEVMTPFSFSAVKWIDQDLPISYQFTYMSVNTGLDLMLQSKSEVNYVSALLPSGNSAANYTLTCKVQVFDNYAASISQTKTVQVELNKVTDVSQLVQNLLFNSTSSDNSSTSSGVTTMLISLASSVLNKVDCSTAPNCSLLHRVGCQLTSGFCGDCLDGYVGQVGPANTACISLDTLVSSAQPIRSLSTANKAIMSRSLLHASTCKIDSDCPLQGLQYCNTVSKTCSYIPKQCPNDCSGHGTCSFVYDYILNSDDDEVHGGKCTVLSTNCVASCSCSEGYAGSSCSMSIWEYEQQRYVRSVLLQALDAVSQVDSVPSSESIQSLVYSLADVIRSQDDFNTQSLDLFYNLALSLFNRVLSDEDIDYSVVVNLLSPLNEALSLATTSSMSSNVLNVMEQLHLFTDILVHESLEDVDALSFVEDYFRIASESFGSGAKNVEVSVPLLGIEEVSGDVLPSSVALSIPDQSAVLQIVEVKSFTGSDSELLQHFDNEQEKDERGFMQGLLHSNPLIISSHFDNGDVIVTIRHDESATFLSTDSSTIVETFQTNCTGVEEDSQYTCSGSGYEIVHHCNATSFGIMTTTCPKQVMTCSQLVSSSMSSTSMICDVTESSEWSTTCRCQSSGSSSTHRRRRRLNHEQQETFTVTAVSYYAANTVKSTFVDGGTNYAGVEGLEKSYIAIMVVATVWIIGFSLYLHQSSNGQFFSFFTAWKGAKKSLPVAIGEAEDDRLPGDEEAGGVGMPRKTLKSIVVASSSPTAPIKNVPSNNGKEVDDYESESLAFKQITAYIQQIFPKVFHQDTWKERVWNELRHHHPLLRSFLVSAESQSHSVARGKTSSTSKRQGTYYSLHAWCVLNLMIFLLALFYDVHQPKDDGSCVLHDDAMSCQQRTLLLDSTRSYCSWQTSDTASTEGYCVYADQSISLRAALIIAVTVSFLTVFLLQVSLTLLKIACAPTSMTSSTVESGGVNADQKQHHQALAKKMFQKASFTSPLPISALNSSVVINKSTFENEPSSEGESNNAPGTIVNDKVIHLHSAAAKAMSSAMMDKTLKKISSTVKERMFNKHKHGRNGPSRNVKTVEYLASDMDDSCDHDVEEEQDDVQSIRPASLLRASSWSVASSWSESSEHRYNKKAIKNVAGPSARDAMLARLTAGTIGQGVIGFGMGSDSPITPEDVEKLFVDLKDDIYLQRQQLQVLQLLPSSSPLMRAASLQAAIQAGGGETELEKFDRVWHLNHYGEFCNGSTASSAPSNGAVAISQAASQQADASVTDDAYVRRLKRDLLRTKQYSRRLLQEIQELQRMVYVSNNQFLTISTVVGMEILHAFVLDLLGRDTLAARIFRWKVQQQQQQQQLLLVKSPLLAITGCLSSASPSAMSSSSLKDAAMTAATVKPWQKYFAMILLIGINGLAALFTVFRGYEKGLAWQQSFAIAAVCQIFIEVFFTETIDCLCIAFFVPNMIAEEVIRINSLLCDVVQEICSNATASVTTGPNMTSPTRPLLALSTQTSSQAATEKKENPKALNMPDYFFVSTNVAKSFPSLLESMIVLSYQSYLPGEFGRKWSRGETDVRSHRSSRRTVNSWGLASCGSWSQRTWWKPSALVTQQVSAATALLLTVFVSMPSISQQLIVRLAQLGIIGLIGQLVSALRGVFSSSGAATFPTSPSPSEWTSGQIIIVSIIAALVVLPICYCFVYRSGSNAGKCVLTQGKHERKPSNAAVGVISPQSLLSSPFSPQSLPTKDRLSSASIDLESPVRLVGNGVKDNVSSDGVMSTAVGVNLSDCEGRETDLDLDLDILLENDPETGLGSLTSWSGRSQSMSQSSSVASHSPLHSGHHQGISNTLPLSPSQLPFPMRSPSPMINRTNSPVVKWEQSPLERPISRDDGGKDDDSSDSSASDGDSSQDSWGHQSESSFTNSVSMASIKCMGVNGVGRKPRHRHHHIPRSSSRPRSLRTAGSSVSVNSFSSLSLSDEERVNEIQNAVRNRSGSIDDDNDAAGGSNSSGDEEELGNEIKNYCSSSSEPSSSPTNSSPSSPRSGLKPSNQVISRNNNAIKIVAKIPSPTISQQPPHYSLSADSDEIEVLQL